MSDEEFAISSLLELLKKAGKRESEVRNGVKLSTVSFADPLESGLEVCLSVRGDTGDGMLVALNTGADLTLAVVRFVRGKWRVEVFDKTTIWPLYVRMLLA